MNNLEEFKRKCLEYIDSKTMRDYLNSMEKLQFSIKEIMSIVYNSHRSIKEKVQFYRELENNFELDYEESEHIKRLITSCKETEKHNNDDFQKSIPVSMYSYDEEKNEMVENKDYNKYPENLYVYLPSPFKIGDIVKDVYSNEKYVVINPELPSGSLAEISDNCDMCIMVVPVENRHLANEEYLDEREKKYRNGTYAGGVGELDEISLYHEHLSILNLEFIEDSRIKN